VLVRKLKEFIIEKLILICGLASIFFVALIFLFLLKEGLAVFKTVDPLKFLFGKSWYPISEPAQLGILPLILGSLLVTLGAAVISIPIGVGCAIYIAEIAPLRLRKPLRRG
jgi:phosphate transport system permease protein